MHRFLRLMPGALALAVCVSAAPAPAAELDKLLPGDSNLVVSVNVQQLVTAEAVKKYALPKLKDALKGDAETEKVLKEFGIDPLTDFTRITLALTTGAGPEKPLIVVKGKFDRAKIETKAAAYAASHPKDLKVAEEGGVKVFETAGGPAPMFVALLDDSTLVVGGTKSLVADAIAQSKGSKKASLNKDLSEMITAADDKQSLWICVLPTVADKLPLPDPNVKKSLDRLAGVAGVVSVADDLKVEIGLVSKDDAAAKDLGMQIEQGLEQAKSVLPIFLGQQEELKPLIELVNSFKSSSKGKTVTIKGALTKEYIEKTLKP